MIGSNKDYKWHKIGVARTWAEKGSKHVLIHSQEDKRQITVYVSSSANRDLLPFQVVFTSTISRYLSPQNEGRLQCEEEGWHLIYIANHWNNLETCKLFVDKILQSYRLKKLLDFNLDEDSKLIWLLDCWSMHMSHEFID